MTIEAGQPGATGSALVTTFVHFSVSPRAGPGPHSEVVVAFETGSHRTEMFNFLVRCQLLPADWEEGVSSFQLFLFPGQ